MKQAEEAYPKFVPPDAVASRSHRDWSRKEAEIYSDWLMGAASERVNGLLAFLGMSNGSASGRDLLLEAGTLVARKLMQDDFSEAQPDGARRLSDAGYALAADMGLLTARLLQEATMDSVRWEILRKPKSDASYNLPVLTGFGSLILDPVGGSVAEATGILIGRRGPDAWARILDFWKGKAR